MYTETAELNKLIGSRIATLMAVRQVTRLKMADDLGVDYDSMRAYIKGRRQIPNSLIKEICDYLGCYVDYLYTGQIAFVIGGASMTAKEYLNTIIIWVNGIVDEEEREDFKKLVITHLLEL